MELTLMDYADGKVTFDIGDINDIARIEIEVFTGDEIARVIYKDYSTDTFDSSGCRMADFYDGGYLIYDINKNVNLLEDPKWKDRKSSYDYMR